MSRHPFSRNWKGPVAFVAAALIAFVGFVWSHSYFLAVGGLLVAIVALLIYMTGESSDLPGTAGDNDKNVPT